MAGISVNVAIINTNGQILLIQREDFEVWGLPGGEVDTGETLVQAAAREAQEETGLEVELTRFVGLYSLPNLTIGNNHTALFAAYPQTDTLKPQVCEVIDAGFFDPNDLPAPLLWWHHQRIQHAINGVGGVLWMQDVRWPFEPGMTREEVYKMRDESGLSRVEFAQKYFGHRGTETLEITSLDNP